MINYNGQIITTLEDLEIAILDLDANQKIYIINDFLGSKNTQVSSNVAENVQGVISAAAQFGMTLMFAFSAENVLLGITMENKTGEVLTKLMPIIPCLQAGSLHEAITRAKAIDPAVYDLKYVTAARLLSFVNKIEVYLDLPLSETL